MDSTIVATTRDRVVGTRRPNAMKPRIQCALAQ